MEVRLNSNGFSCYHKVFSTVIPKDVSQEMVVSDTMPDIASVITTEGIVLIRSKDVADGKIRLEASIHEKICYLPENGEGFCCLDVSIPLYVSAENEAITSDCKCLVRLILKSQETKVLNPRKVSANAMVEISVDCFLPGESVFQIMDSSDEAHIHVLEQETEQSVVCCVTEKTFVLTDELSLPQDKSPVAEIIGEHVSFAVDELKPVGSKLIMRGNVHSHLLYYSADNIADTVEFVTPFSQIIDTECETENTNVFASIMLSGLYFDVASNMDGHCINMELHAVAQVKLCGNAAARYIADAYSNTFSVILRKDKREAVQLCRESTLHDTIRTQVESAEPLTEVLSACVNVLETDVTNSNVRLRLLARMYCKSTNGTLLVIPKTFSVELPVQLDKNEKLLVSSTSIGEVYSAPMENGAELRAAMELRCVVCVSSSIDCITAIEYDEATPLDLGMMPSLVILNASSEDDLWCIAKENCSTVTAIREVNGLEEDDKAWEKLLLIPRTT